MRTYQFCLALILFVVVCNAGAPGEPVEANINDPIIVKARDFAVKQLESSVGPKKELVELISAKKQIVTGSLVILTFRTSDQSDCTVSIWSRPWLNKQEIASSTCGHDIGQRGKRAIKNEETYFLMFDKFMENFGKKYDSKAEYKKRYHIFKSNLKKINLLNSREQGTAKYGVNKFADLSTKEFKKYLGLVRPETVPSLPQAEIPNIEIPMSYDWRDHNAVTPIKNQGSCGSCWAFSVTGNVEGQWAIQHGELLSLSEQELLDCDNADNGCNGGLMTTAYNSVVSMGGFESEKDYPYEAQTETCQLNASEIEVTIKGGVNISSDEGDMAKWLFQNGPISIALNANAMQFYKSGISHPSRDVCDPNGLDHGVLIVGYGYDRHFLFKKLPYWIIKNSWGEDWGEKGYYRLYRGDGSCGVNLDSSSAVL